MGLYGKMAGLFGRIKNGLKTVVSKAGGPLGMAIGSMVPGVGTALGGAIGGGLQALANR